MTASFPTLESLPSSIPVLHARPAHLASLAAFDEELEAVADEDILEIESLAEEAAPSTQRSPVCEALLSAPSRPVPAVVCHWAPASVLPVAPASLRPLPPALLGDDDEEEPVTVSSQDLEFTFEKSGTRRLTPEQRRPATVVEGLRATRLGAPLETRAPLAHCG